MKIKYQYANGDFNEIEVSEELGAVMVDLDRLQYNNNQSETRRHRSLDWLMGLGLEFSDDTEVSDEVEINADIDNLRRAIAQLKPKQQEMIKAIFFEGVSVNDYAFQENVDHSAISHRLITVYKKLKKLF